MQPYGPKMKESLSYPKFGRKRSVDTERLQALHKNGLGATDIAKQMGIGRSTVYKLLNETGV
jgi:hypothetical protein